MAITHLMASACRAPSYADELLPSASPSLTPPHRPSTACPLSSRCPLAAIAGPTQVDGTSCSSPVFAGMVSNLNAIRIAAGKPVLGFLNPLIVSRARKAGRQADRQPQSQEGRQEVACECGCDAPPPSSAAVYLSISAPHLFSLRPLPPPVPTLPITTCACSTSGARRAPSRTWSRATTTARRTPPPAPPAPATRPPRAGTPPPAGACPTTRRWPSWSPPCRKHALALAQAQARPLVPSPRVTRCAAPAAQRHSLSCACR